MGLMDRIKRVTGVPDQNDNRYDEDYYNGFDDMGYDVADEGEMPADDRYDTMGGSRRQDNDMGGISLSGSNIKMQVVRPKNYDSETASQIANHLLNKATVVLNLESTNKEASRRLIDFLSGVAYSIGGSLKKIATNAYVVTPSNVDVGESRVKTEEPAPQPQPKVEEPTVGIADFADFN